MRLFDAIIEANHRALAGDPTAGLHPQEFESELPLVALTCIDVRLNPLLPAVLGIPRDQFIWLRNAGNMIDGPEGAMMRALALACAIDGAREIVVIGHTDCQMAKTSAADLGQRLRGLNTATHLLPSNIQDFFGLFACARTNVVKAVDLARHSPLVGPNTPIHGLMVDTLTGQVEWVVNGYDDFRPFQQHSGHIPSLGSEIGGGLKALPDMQIGEIKFPTEKIGDTVTDTATWLANKAELRMSQQPAAPAKPVQPPRIPIPPPFGGTIRIQKRPK